MLDLTEWTLLTIVFGIIAALLFIYSLILHSKINTLYKKYNLFMNGEDGRSLERKLAIEVKEVREAAQSMEQLFQQQAIIRNVQNNTFQKIGLVKYNAFDNIGNDLSFALTLLDGNDSGICISSVYGRNESRIFSKPIVKGKSLLSLSQEEGASLHKALHTHNNKAVATDKEKA